MKELTAANKVGLILMVVAIGVVGGMECGKIALESGTTWGIICSALALLLWA